MKLVDVEKVKMGIDELEKYLSKDEISKIGISQSLYSIREKLKILLNINGLRRN